MSATKKDDTLLLINEANQLVQKTHYLAIPWAFKKIINKVLTPRELTVYIQIGFYMGKDEVCFPSLEQLAEDMDGVSRGNQLSAPINRLVDKGFLLKTKRSIPWRVENYRKLIFQRPSVAYTLYTLRSQGRITETEYQEILADKLLAVEEWRTPKKRGTARSANKGGKKK